MTEIRLDAEPDDDSETGGDRPPGATRSRWIAAYVVALLVLTAAIVSFVDVVGSDPDDVVRDYLDAVRDGDTAEALALATVKPKRGDPRDTFLESGALRANWRITSAGVRAQSAKKAIVDASITGPDGERDGVFRLERSRTGDWRITNPFVPLFLARPPVWTNGNRDDIRVNLNGVSVTMRDDEPASGVSESSGIQLRLFPGSYAFFDGDKLVKPADATQTWLPPGDSSSFVPYTPWLELTGPAARLAADQVGEKLRECVKRTERTPDGCPFGTDGTVTLDGDERELDGGAITWRLDDEPELYFADTGLGHFRPVERGRTTVEMSFTVRGEPHSIDCSVDWAILSFALSTDGTLVFTEPYENAEICY